MSHGSAEASDLLALCAMLRRFNRERLHALAGAASPHVEHLLAGDQVEALPGAPGWYALRPEARAQALAQLRAGHPADETRLHTRAFDHCLARLRDTDRAARTPDDEDDCLHHLDALFILVGAGMDWEALLERTLAVAKTEPRQQRHVQRVLAYEGYIAIRTQRAAYGEEILARVLDGADVDADVRIKALKGLADAALDHSHYGRALALYEELQAAARDAGDRAYQGLALLDTGLVYHRLSQYELARDYCERSLGIFRALGDQRREGYALYHSSLYSTYLGRWEAAEHYIRKAADVFEQLGLPTYLGFVRWLQGYIYHIFDDAAASEAAYLRALALAQSPDHGQPSLEMDAWLYLGVLYHTQGRHDEALAHYERALALATKLERPHQVCRIHYRIGQTLQRQGRLNAALDAYRIAIDSIELLRGATEREDIKIGLVGTTQQLYEAAVLLCLELGRDAEAFHIVERARSRALLDALAKKLDDDVAPAPAIPTALAHDVVTLVDVQASLPAGALLLEYFTAGVLPRGEHLINSLPTTNTRLREHLSNPPQVILFAVTRDAFAVHRLSLNPNSLRPPIGDRYPGRHLLHGRLPQSLYERLVAPAADLLARHDTLYVVPHGPLHYVPFAALRAPDGRPLIRAGGPALAQAPSATILLRHCLGRPAAGDGGMLAIGFDDPQGEQPLRFAEAEARHVAHMFGGTAWTGSSAKSQRLLGAARGARWLHIASHAHFRPEDPLASELYLGPGDALSARAIIRDLHLRAELVTLSSCTSGVSHVVPGDELLGLQRALLFAGAPAVVCTRWEASDVVAMLMMDRFYAGLRAGHAPAAALRDAQVFIRDVTRAELDTLLASWRAEVGDLGADLDADDDTPPDAQPFADPLFWAPFMLIGRA